MKEIDELKKTIASNNSFGLNLSNLAKGNDKYVLQYHYLDKIDDITAGTLECIEVCWDNLFQLIGSKLYNESLLETDGIEYILNSYINREIFRYPDSVSLTKDCLTQILVQFESLDYINRNVRGYWRLTNKGKEYFLSLISVKSQMQNT